MVAKQYGVFLTADERTRLQHLLNGGTAAAGSWSGSSTVSVAR